MTKADRRFCQTQRQAALGRSWKPFLKILGPELLFEVRQNLAGFSRSSLARIYLWTLTRETVALCLPGLCVFHWAECPDKDKHSWTTFKTSLQTISFHFFPWAIFMWISLLIVQAEAPGKATTLWKFLQTDRLELLWLIVRMLQIKSQNYLGLSLALLMSAYCSHLCII